ncbi:hypothetical protein KY285_010508 [Solanum tuberosum]|nr:hypothetical protein KY289_011052 [Solanum tuberosum]KAH0734801.1 hypothetical protein KY285_010508 [Solanum tuberosum]
MLSVWMLSGGSCRLLVLLFSCPHWRRRYLELASRSLLFPSVEPAHWSCWLLFLDGGEGEAVMGKGGEEREDTGASCGGRRSGEEEEEEEEEEEKGGAAV